MALSVLRSGNAHGLYDSKKKKMIMVGTENEMYGWKHKIEDAEQQKDNRQYMNQVKKDRILELVQSGYTQEEATTFLK